MTLSRGAWVKQNGTVGLTAVELRRVDAACYYQTTPGTARSGLLWKNTPTFQLVTPAANMSYDLQPVPGFVIGRAANEGAYTVTAQGVTNIGTGAAPASGLSRWDLIWLKQNDVEKGDADNLPVLGVTQGAAASAPTKPTASVPSGAVVLAEAQIFSGTTGTNGSPNTITQLWRYTAMQGDPVPVRNTTERGELSAPRIGDQVARLDLAAHGTTVETWTGTAWLLAGAPRIAEFTGPVVSTTAGNMRDLGALVLETGASAQTVNSSFVEPGTTGRLKILETGTYNVRMMVLGTASSGTGFMRVRNMTPNKLIHVESFAEYITWEQGISTPAYFRAGDEILFEFVSNKSQNWGSNVLIQKVG